MTQKPKLLFIDGPDGAGKTTLVKMIKWKYPEKIKVLNFDKSIGGLLRINRPDQFVIMKVLIEHLNPEYIYVMDRCYLSNMVYDRVLRDDAALPSIEFRNWLKSYYTTMEILLTRSYITDDIFKDDRIEMTGKQFNTIIDEYKAYGQNFHLINSIEDTKILGKMLHDFITTT